MQGPSLAQAKIDFMASRRGMTFDHDATIENLNLAVGLLLGGGFPGAAAAVAVAAETMWPNRRWGWLAWPQTEDQQ